ncbi:hypothetical protein L1887_54514 [Cichorium endivia]|nr:hypothetical protein L1887_54514 [Cichorium endivia]
MVEELTAVDKRQHEVQLVRTLEREFERHDERIVDLRQHGALGQRVRHLGARHNVRLADGLERVDARRVALAHLHHLAKAALADHLEQLKRVHVERAARVAAVRKPAHGSGRCRRRAGTTRPTFSTRHKCGKKGSVQGEASIEVSLQCTHLVLKVGHKLDAAEVDVADAHHVVALTVAACLWLVGAVAVAGTQVARGRAATSTVCAACSACFRDLARPKDWAREEALGLCMASALATAGGVGMPAGSERPRASMTRMVSRPERGMGAPSDEAVGLEEDDALGSGPGLPGVGVAERSSGVRAPRLAPSLNSGGGKRAERGAR